ncbi:hypothetical protein STPYR_13083 [uncultured Stenotrophomonas sp.]|uniref:Uncharacterized protein n=1 Tax=uncultured Stenotrophomonas sp. TaxID=165438 RepID=A0A1Y5Q7B7_9GAMM|nr:hypothetical protein STPYR_13083 [uncultured Stenotrophomonas sp.]
MLSMALDAGLPAARYKVRTASLTLFSESPYHAQAVLGGAAVFHFPFSGIPASRRVWSSCA